MTSNISIKHGDALEYYNEWPAPDVIISDGPYGVNGFDGDLENEDGLDEWYRSHVEEWSRSAKPNTTLWFWGTELSYAEVHSVLTDNDWEYVSCNIWNKGISHVSGNTNTNRIRHFPKVTEVCVQYHYKPDINGHTLQEWIRSEWKRTGLPFDEANAACNVSNAASRKYLTPGDKWYFPPPDKMEMLTNYANEHGDETGKPYFEIGGEVVDSKMWSNMRPGFECPAGVTNVWDCNPVRGNERGGHPNQKPRSLYKRILTSSSDSGDVVWEPFAGSGVGLSVANELNREVYAAEIDAEYYKMCLNEVRQNRL